jgi:hypothetical protein
MSKYDNKLIIIEKYTEFVNYIYPVLQNVERKHGVLKSETLTLILSQVELLYRALKSGNMKSRLYEVDTKLASIRWHLRFLADDKRKLISKKQLGVASIILSEVGGILQSWIEKARK